ncbi:MAG: hypothetical protein Q8Q32_01525 [bacterium]|nr:hypothetical protein [bacterium]
MNRKSKKTKNHYTKRLTKEHEELIIRHLRKEWDRAEKSQKRHQQVQKAKQAGLEAGKVILALALVGGLVTIAAVAPNAFAAIGSMGERKRFISSSKLSGTIKSGSSKKYWQYKKTGPDSYSIQLSDYGKKLALKKALQEFKLQEQEKWDGKWRVVMFDIKKKNSSTRDIFRRKLHEMGMYPLQKSIFVFPYPCDEELKMWIDLFGIKEGVVTSKASFNKATERSLRKRFSLPMR